MNNIINDFKMFLVLVELEKEIFMIKHNINLINQIDEKINKLLNI